MKETVLHASQNIAFSKEIVKNLPQAIAKRLPVEISVVSVSEKESAELNRRYREKDKTTNVLSFRYGKEYGEIIVCPAVVRREARRQKHTFRYQMTWMILHGMIHLSGLHHEQSPVAAKKTEAVEKRILDTIFNFNGSQHNRIS